MTENRQNPHRIFLKSLVCSRRSWGDIKFFMGLLVAIIFLVVIAVFFLAPFKDIYREKTFDAVCQQTIKAHMLGKKTIVGENLKEFPCKPKKVTIKGNRKYDVLKGSADNQVRCTNSFFRGQENLFNGTVGEYTSFCVPCYIQDFENKGITASVFEKMDFEMLNANRNEKYIEIFAGKGAAKDFLAKRETLMRDEKLRNTVAIDTSKEYLVLFRYKKLQKSEIDNILDSEIGSALTGSVAGALVGVGLVVGIGVFTVATGGAGLFLVAGALSVAVPLAAAGGGIAGGYVGYTVFYSDDSGDVWTASIENVEFTPENLENLGCDRIIGMAEQGITQKNYLT